MIEPRLASDLRELLDHTPAQVWSAFRGQRLFLTGGTGFVGKWLLSALLHANSELGLGLHLTVLSRDPDAFATRHRAFAPSATLTYRRGDIECLQYWGSSYDGLIHAALPVAPAGAGDAGLAALAKNGILRACAFAAQAGARRVLHVSSGAVYGRQPADDLVAESANWNEAGTDNAYTLAKRAAERVVAGRWPFDTVAARLFGFVGPYLSASNGTAAAEFVELAAQGKQIIVHGTGEALRSYQYASDMARWLVVLYAHGRPGSAYNVGGSDHLSIAALAHQVARVVTPEVTVRITGGRHAGLAPPGSYLPCLKKAESELGLQNIVSLPEAIRRTLQWHSEAA